QQLKTLADKEREARERRAYIAQQISDARQLLESGKTREALEVIEGASKKFAGEPALQPMTVLIKETLHHEELDRQIKACTQQTKDLLRRKQYGKAIEVLESAQKRLKTTELDDLIQFARDEATNYARRQQIASITQEANRLMALEEYERAIQFLEVKLVGLPVDELQVVLSSAQRHLEDFNKSVADIVRSAQALVSEQRLSEAVRLLESQPRSFSKSSEFTATLEQVRIDLKNQRFIATAKEQVRDSIGSEDFETAESIVETCRRELGDISDVLLLAAEVNSRRNEIFSRRLKGALADARTLLLGKSYRSALELLDGVAPYAKFVSAELEVQYESLRARTRAGIE